MYNGSKKKLSSHSYFEIILSIIGRMETIEYTSWNCRGVSMEMQFQNDFGPIVYR